jgi:hypothetical protein
MGIVFMARRRYREAAEAFDAALRAQAPFPLAEARARQSRTLLARDGETDDDND